MVISEICSHLMKQGTQQSSMMRSMMLMIVSVSGVCCRTTRALLQEEGRVVGPSIR